jgi:aspartyl/asparaginyl beta-hydroxylase (cupin superfamily)/Tfp pilus assembly protein PilF
MVATPPPSLTRDPQVADLERRAIDAMQVGRQRDALSLWHRIAELQPDHSAAHNQIGQAAFNAGDLEAARTAFERAAAAEPQNPTRWVNLAMTRQRLGDDAGAEQAVFKALAAEPRDLMALLLRGNLYERQGKTAQAASAYGAALAVSPPLDRLHPELRPALGHAAEYAAQQRERLAGFLDGRLEAAFQDCGRAGLERFRLSLDIMLGRKRRYDPQPLIYYYPNLAPAEFFPREQFPWLDAIEAGTESIREEFLTALQADSGFVPYIHYAADQPVDQWAELNHNPRWSVLHLVKGGEEVTENASRCPQTMRLWRQHVPAPVQAGRTPVALFSCLKPRTHIPAHTGASNVRLLAHLPLIVPPNCRFRVGNTVCEWVPGRAWVFDDTIEHEAWNDSDQLRVVMIFDHWHPALAPEERRMITALNAALAEFGGGAGDYSA